MQMLFNFPWITDQAIAIIPGLLLLNLKISFLIILGIFLSKTRRLTSATVRHFIWALIFLSALTVPLIQPIIPQWHWSADEITHEKQAASDEESALVGGATEIDSFYELQNKSEATKQEPDAQPVATQITLAQRIETLWQSVTLEPFYLLSALLWLSGVLLLSLRLLVGRFYIRRMVSRADECHDGQIMKLFNQLKTQLQYSTSTRLFISKQITVPLSCGIFHPRIIVPADFPGWTYQHQRYALVHELGHVVRKDAFTQLLAQLALTVYWFNPLLWLAQRHYVKEREQACDDFVLNFGSKPSEYAHLLLDLVRTMPTQPLLASFRGLFMASSTQLEGRLLSILNSKTKRSHLNRWGLFKIGCLFMLIVIPLTALTFTQPQDLNQTTSLETTALNEESATSIKKTAPDTNRNVRRTEPPEAERVTHPELWLALTEKSLEVRLQAVWTAFELKEKGIDLLCEATKDTCWEVRKIAAWALGEIKSPLAIDALSKLMRDKNRDVRRQALQTLRKMKDPATLPAFYVAITDPDRNIRDDAVEAIGELKDPDSIPALTEALKDESEDVREEAVEALDKLKQVEAIPALCLALQDRDNDIRQDAAAALDEFPDPRALKALLEALDDPGKGLRAEVIESLGDMKYQAALNPLIQQLARESDKGLRKKVIWALGEIGNPAVTEILIQLLSAKERDIKREAIRALARIKDRRAVLPISRALSDSDWKIRYEATTALDEFKDPRAVDYLLPALGDKKDKVREETAETLGEIGDPRAVPALCKRLNDDESDVRQKAAWALGEIGNPAALAALNQAIKDKNLKVSREAAAAIRKIKAR